MSKIQYGPTRSDSIAIFSGGMDSTVLVYKLLEEGHVPHLLSFNYGQRHSKELLSAEIIAYELKLQHDIVDLTGLTHLINNSALTSPRFEIELQDGSPLGLSGHIGKMIEVPEGHYAEDNMKKTVVPNRNMIMLSIAAGVAVNNSYKFVATGVHAGDHFVYPDCRPKFIRAADAAIVYGNEGFGPIPKQQLGSFTDKFIEAPFLNVSKEDIAYLGLKFKVPFHLTWSCYKGGDKHCGKCGTCVERLEAIDGAQKRYHQEHQTYGPVDRTDYEDTEFWKEAVANAR
jgi:7-cyano-7-deazaguanine synthase